MTDVVAVIGAGSIGVAIARRIGAARHVLLADLREETAAAAAKVLAALLMGPDGAFITGSDFLMDGGVTASYFYGDLAPKGRS